MICKRINVWRGVIRLFILMSILSGCASIPLPTASGRVGMDDPPGHCADFFEDLDRRVVQAQAIDPGAFRVPGYPYLRVDRFLASFREAVDDAPEFAAWVNRMQALDQNARKHEIANLPDAGTSASREVLYDTVVACGNLLKAIDFREDGQRRALRRKITAPDDYILARQILGIYPITRWLIAQGVSRWHAESQREFSVEPPTQWQTIRYLPEISDGHSKSSSIIRPAGHDALSIPYYTTDARNALFQNHAPVWEVQTQGNHDRIGTPFWTSEGGLAVDTSRPVTYTRLSYTRFQGNILTQLNYIVWFPYRPKAHALDIYGGLLDGLNYRVTLDAHGKPLLYETVHHCGCYYAAYPTHRLTVRDKIAYTEPPLILAAPGIGSNRQRITVAMQSRTHFVRHLYWPAFEGSGNAVVYDWSAYDRLRSLDDAQGGRRSMFDPNSLVPGTQRLERWLFWPTGVLSAGAMRQWGRHAVAFAGRRHFDDPFFMEAMFESDDQPATDANLDDA